MVDTFGTATVAESKISAALREVFLAKPRQIVEQLDLLKPIFRKTAAYGHFGREEPSFTWERTGHVDALKGAVGAYTLDAALLGLVQGLQSSSCFQLRIPRSNRIFAWARAQSTLRCVSSCYLDCDNHLLSRGRLGCEISHCGPSKGFEESWMTIPSD